MPSTTTSSTDDTGGYDPHLLEEAARTVRSGGLIAFPTDTFYGLGADPFKPEAVAALFRAKGRPDDRPVPLLLADPEDVKAVAADVSLVALQLARRFWPGALTLVLRRLPRVPDIVTAGGDTVGVRVPDHPVPRAIARLVPGPITGTSANPSGAPPYKTAEEVSAAFGNRLDLVVPGACGGHTEPSTVVDCTENRPRVLRAGALSLDELRSVCPDVLPPRT